MTLTEFVALKDFYIGKTAQHDDGELDIVKDIIMDGDYMKVFLQSGHMIGGTKEGCHVCAWEKSTSVGVNYCGGFDIIH